MFSRAAESISRLAATALIKCISEHQDLNETQRFHLIQKARADPDFIEVINKFKICNGDILLPLGKNYIITLYNMYNELKSHMSVNQQSNQPVVTASLTQPSTSTVNRITTTNNPLNENNGTQSTHQIERASNSSAPPTHRPFETCIVCLQDLSAMNLDEITIHMNKHLDQGTQEQYSSSVDVQQLVVNEKMKNSLVDNQEYICDYCNNGFNDKKDLLKHMQFAHVPTKVELRKAAKVCGPKQRVLACSQCPKKYSKMSSYKRHLLTHSGIKFQCTLCSKSLSTKDNLNRHIKSAHRQSYDESKLIKIK